MAELFVVKRQGHAENFDEKKLYSSIYASALNAHKEDLEAEFIAKGATNHIKDWMKMNPTVKAHKIKLEIIKFLKKEDNGVAIMYEHHRNIC